MTNLSWFDGSIEHNRANVTLVNNTAKTQALTVPTGKRWYLFGGYLTNGDDVARNCYVQMTDGTNNMLMLFPSTAVGATVRDFFPRDGLTGQFVTYPIPMSAGWTLSFTFAAGGASAGGTGNIAAIVLEVPA